MSGSATLREGLWSGNPGLVQLLGLCPLLAVSNTVVNALGLGLATLITIVMTNSVVALTRPLLAREIRIPIFVLVIAGTVTAVDRIMAAYWFELHANLGIFVPLIITNCMILGRAEAFASRNSLPAAALDGFARGLGFMAALLALGALRELVGRGTLLSDAGTLLGPAAEGTVIRLAPADWQFLVAMLPPGAFIGLGLLVALHRWIDLRRRRRAQPEPAPATT